MDYLNNEEFYWTKKGGEGYYEERKNEPCIDQASVFLYNLLKEQKPQSILEAGCGYGRLLISLLEYNFIEKIYGIDISETQIRKGQKLINDTRVEFIKGDVLNINFCKKVDLIFTRGFFTHFHPTKIKNGLNKIISFLNKNGFLVLMEYGLREEYEIKKHEDIGYNLFGTYFDGSINDTWGYDYLELIKGLKYKEHYIFVPDHNVYIYRRD